MQIFECIINYKTKYQDKINFLSQKSAATKQAQNLIEFIFVFPMLLFMTLVIFEVAFFWQEANAIYNLNEEINANIATLDYSNMNMGTRCLAADKDNPKSAISIFKKRDSMISLTSSTYNESLDMNNPDLVVDGREPFSLYKFTSDNKINGNPQITLWVDCRNPFENGIMTQIEFYHKTLIMKATIPRFDKSEGIVIIPDNIFISSPQLRTIRHY